MRPLLLFDADCGFCTRVARLVPVLRLPVTVAPMQSVDLRAVGVDPGRAAAELPFVRADGVVVYGHAAVAAALDTGAAALRIVGRLLVSGPLDGFSRRVYRWAATHRHRLPGGTAACALPSPAPPPA